MMNKKSFFGLVMVVVLTFAPQQVQTASLSDTWNSFSVEAKCVIAVPVIISGLVVGNALYESLPWVKELRENERLLKEKNRQEAERLHQEELIKRQKDYEYRELVSLNKQLDSLEHDCLVYSVRMTELLALGDDHQLFIAKINEYSCYTTESLVKSFNELKNFSSEIRGRFQRFIAVVIREHSSSYFPQEWCLLSARLEQEGVSVQIEDTVTVLTKVIAQIKQQPEFVEQLAAVEKRIFLAETKALLEKQVAAYVKAQTALEKYEKERARAEQLRLEVEIARLSGSLNTHYYDLFGATSNVYVVDVQSELNALLYTVAVEREKALRVEERRLVEEARRQAEVARQQAEKSRLQAEQARRECEAAEKRRKQEESCRKNDQVRQAREDEKVRQEKEKAKSLEAKKKSDEAAQKKLVEEKKQVDQKQREQERQEQYDVYHDFWN